MFQRVQQGEGKYFPHTWVGVRRTTIQGHLTRGLDFRDLSTTKLCTTNGLTPCPYLLASRSHRQPPAPLISLLRPQTWPLSSPLLERVLTSAHPRVTQFTGSSKVAEILAQALDGKARKGDQCFRTTTPNAVVWNRMTV